MEANGLTRRSKHKFRVNFLPRDKRYQPSEHRLGRQPEKKASLGRHVRKAKWNTPNCESGAIVKMTKNQLEACQTQTAATEVNQGRRVSETDNRSRMKWIRCTMKRQSWYKG